MVPVLILCGEAGSGKDTVANHLKEARGAVCIGQADPLKHMAREWFGFTDEQLFGPSACRNAVDERFSPVDHVLPNAYYDARERLSHFGTRWCRQLFPSRAETAADALLNWWNDHIYPAALDARLSPRLVLQTLGTEWGRKLDERVWVRHALDIAFDCLGGGWEYNRLVPPVPSNGFRGYDLAVVTDGRFRNEILETKRAGGLACNVVRPANLSAEAQAAGVQGHRSEAELSGVPPHFYDYRIKNDGTLSQLYYKADFVADKLLHLPTGL